MLNGNDIQMKFYLTGSRGNDSIRRNRYALLKDAKHYEL